jgi:arylsulfatase A-like enzyme
MNIFVGKRAVKLSLIFCWALIFLVPSSCRKSQVIYDLVREQGFAQKTGEFFIHDYMAEENDDWRGWGWSRLRKEGTRLATYPSSRLRFVAEEKTPLHLFCLCNPYVEDDAAAQSIRVFFNEEELITVDLEQGVSRLIDIVLPEEKIKRGNNWVEFFYSVDHESSPEETTPPDEKRTFSIVASELILSSHPDLNYSKEYLQLRQSLKPAMKPGSIVQKIPSTMDFYLHIPDKAIFEASGDFYPSVPGLLTEENIDLEIAIRAPEKEEAIVHSHWITREKSRISLDISIPGSGVRRLRLKAGDEADERSLKGFLVWDNLQVIGRGNKKEAAVSKDALSPFRDVFADNNLVFIIFDAARADHFSTYGYFRPTTPQTDKFARNSIRFTDAYSEAISTRCSMGTLFTGFPLTVTSLTEVTSGLPRELTTLAQLFRSRGFKTTGYTGIGNVASVFRFDRGFDQYFELYKEEGFFRKSQQYLPYVLPWLEANKDKKFFLYIHFKEPHAVYRPLPPFLGMFSEGFEETVDLTAYHDRGKELSEQQVEYIRACYDENLASVDSAFGMVMDKLEDLGLDENTFVILTADHGDLLGENGRLFGHGDYFGEGDTHIPLFIRFPHREGLDIPERIDSLVKLSDLFATLADVYGFEVPWDMMGGKSLLPVISGAVKEVNPFVVVEKRDRTGFCIRTKSHKLIYWEDAPTEFYDLAQDPPAENNIYRQDDVMASYMLTTLKKWIAAQELIKAAVLGKSPSDKDIRYDQIDKETLENLKALGYIK